MNSIHTKRLGQSSLRLDCSNLQTAGLVPSIPSKNVWPKLRSDFKNKVSAFYDAPIDLTISKITEVNALARKFKNTTQFTHCLFIGIGGSSLGPKSFLKALPFQSEIEILFIENPDPDDWRNTISKLDPKSTLICCATKSGKTFETLSLFLLALEWIGKKRWKNQVVCITDPESGDLRKLSQLENLATLPIDPKLGGRFSIFSPVGLFPMAMSGINCGEFLSGAMKIRDYFEKTPIDQNPIFHISHQLIQNFKSFPIHVLMPYTSLLKEFSLWWIQLWAESLGKDNKGFTPISAVGAVDQHSLLQLLKEGPLNKTVFFIRTEKFENDIRIPKLNWSNPEKFETIPLLEDQDLKHLLTLEYNATSRVLVNRHIPLLSLHLDKITESSLGSLYFLFSVWTSYLGYAWKINPFNQPGVEEGKNYVREALKVDAPAHSL